VLSEVRAFFRSYGDSIEEFDQGAELVIGLGALDPTMPTGVITI